MLSGWVGSLTSLFASGFYENVNRCGKSERGVGWAWSVRDLAKGRCVVCPDHFWPRREAGVSKILGASGKKLPYQRLEAPAFAGCGCWLRCR